MLRGDPGYRPPTFSVKTQQGVTVLTVSGNDELDICARDTFDCAVQLSVNAGQPSVIDLRNVRYLDASAISVLAKALRTGHSLNLVFDPTVNNTVGRILGITGFLAKLPIFPDINAAIAAIHSGAA